ncbi:uncharacterized protein LOC125656719 [Ostrea edulis]|uniref:uncharacterized protein LOC125656719 n=1 Tax=Ostrea edulis TaxID=37623 RepID=UPI00209411C9|nr:uncharacterized protein LOC125656719 [Ostrea edulis]
MVFIKEVLKAIVIQPLSVGNIRQSGGRRRTDGNVSSAVLFSCLLAIIVVIIGVFGPLSLFNRSAKLLLWFLTMGLVLVSLICIVFLSLMIFRNKRNWVDPRTESPDPATRLKVKFLWLFGCGTILQTALTAAINIDCLAIEDSLSTYYIGSLISSMFKVLYIVWQMGFITYLQNSIFVSRKMVNYSVAVMIICNISIWCAVVSDEISHALFNATDAEPPIQNDSLDSECSIKSKIYLFSSKIQPYLIPVRIEYLLLASMFVFRMWPTFRVVSVSPERELEITSNSYHTGNRERITLIAAAICASVTNLPFFIQTLLMATVYKGDTGVPFDVWHVIVSIHNVLNLILTFICFHLLRRTAEVQICAWQPGASEYILLLTNAGQAADDTFGLIAASGCYCLMSTTVQVSEVSSLLQAFFQTIFILDSTRYRQQTTNLSSRILRFTLIYLFISNLSFWFTATFIGLDGQVISEGQSDIFKDKATWSVLESIVYPLFMFFRFHSAMYFYSLYHRFS